jgi:hypothetical protein
MQTVHTIQAVRDFVKHAKQQGKPLVLCQQWEIFTQDIFI